MKPAAILLVVASVASAGTTDDGVPEERYVEYGKTFAPFVRLVVVADADGKLASGSCVVIAPRVVLTAAHIVDKAVAGVVGENAIEAIHCHPEYDESSPFWADIAVLRCKDDFGLAYYPPLTTQRHKVGEMCSIAGYGATGRISSGVTRHGGELLAGTQTIFAIERGLLVCFIGRGSSPLEYGIASGDSGGPLFVGSGPAARLAGINSCLLPRKGSAGEAAEGCMTTHAEIAEFAGWIEEVMR